MSSLQSLSLLGWITPVAALLLFLGLGYGLLSFYPARGRFDWTQRAALSVGLSIAFWSILLSWLHGLRVILSPPWVVAILAVFWVVGLLRTRPWARLTPRERGERPGYSSSRLALWGILVLATAVRLWALRDVVAGPGSDSYHHTLIAQMIAARGILPDDYQPVAPIVTFTYHFGFHGLVAAITWLTGMSTVALVPIVGQILNALAALSVAFFTQVATRNRLAAMVSAVFAGFVAVFPAYFINWGRYTQLTGLVVLPIFLGLVWRWIDSDFPWSSVPFIGVLAAGIALTHYRVTLMAMVGLLVLLGVEGLARKVSWTTWKRVICGLMLAGVIAGILTAPWVWHVLKSLQKGYPIDVGTPTAMYFSLGRMGSGVLAIILGWWRRERVVIVLSIWAVAVLILATPRLAGVFMDTVSVFVSLYFPASVVVGWALMTSAEWLAVRWRPSRWIAWIGLLFLLIRGWIAIGSIVEPGSAYVGSDDLPAMEWIRSNTPPSAYFMVNTFHWSFLPDLVIGSDAGYWMPLLAGRRTVTVPMTYANERSNLPEFADRLASLDQLGGHLTTPEALTLLHDEGITHVYVGQRGGQIVLEELLKSPAFQLEYQNGSAYVFQLR